MGQIAGLRDCVQERIASGKDFQVILDNQPTMSSLYKALAMRTYIERVYEGATFLWELGNCITHVYGIGEVSVGLFCPVLLSKMLQKLLQ